MLVAVSVARVNQYFHVGLYGPRSERGMIMKNLDIDKNPAGHWIVSVREDKLKEIVCAAQKLEFIQEVREFQSIRQGDILISFSPLTDDSDRKELETMLERMTGEARKPSFLDQRWVYIPSDNLVIHIALDGCPLFADYKREIAGLPGLTRAWIEHLKDPGKAYRNNVVDILNKMGIDVEGL